MTIPMDPKALELYESGAPDDEVSLILRLADGAELPPTVRIVSRFDDIVTARVMREDIPRTRTSPGVLSLKASDIVTLPPSFEDLEFADAIDEESSGRSMPGADVRAGPEDGRGVLVGVCDWGFDFTHPNFRNSDGTTRLRSLWDQRGGAGDPRAPAPYNYGRLLTRDAINAALSDADPCASLGYHPASGDPSNTGAHGTHVCDILAGNRREPGSEVGLASGSDIVFVHLAAPRLGEVENLGDSVGLLEGLDFIRQQAAGQPCVLHLSAGKTGGPHRGDTLLERAVDAMLKKPGIALIQSVGNYAHTAMHAHARVGPDQRHVFDWLTPRHDRTPNELEIWYSGHDVFDLTVIAPGGREFSAPLNNRVQIGDGSTVWGNLYHRLHEPNSGFNHIVAYLYTAAPSGRWQVRLHGREIVDGRLHAWIERDAGGRYQSRFPRSQASSRYTTNTICNSFRAIAVGAYDATQPGRPPTRFSSRGPTADGRQKPEVAAPGYRIRAARSMPKHGWQPGDSRLTVKSGTSMAAPWVSGAVALMMSAARRPLTIHEIRCILVGAADPHAGPSGRTSTQLGFGYLNVAKAVEAARELGRIGASQPATGTTAGEDELSDRLGEPPVWVEDAAETLLEEQEMDGQRDIESLPTDIGDKPMSEDAEQDEGLDLSSPFESFEDIMSAPFTWEDVEELMEEMQENDAS
jgi:subtilisin family serine protease